MLTVVFSNYLLSSFFLAQEKFGFTPLCNAQSKIYQFTRCQKNQKTLRIKKKDSMKKRNLFDVKVEKDLKGSLDSISSPSYSVKKESLFTSPRNVLPYYIK